MNLLAGYLPDKKQRTNKVVVGYANLALAVVFIFTAAGFLAARADMAVAEMENLNRDALFVFAQRGVVLGDATDDAETETEEDPSSSVSPAPAPAPSLSPQPSTEPSPSPTPTPSPSASPITTYSGNTVPLKLINQSGTYYVVKEGKRLGVTNPGMLFSHGLEFKDAATPTAQETALPQGNILPPGDGALVKSPSSPTVYLISKGQKYGFASELAFNSLGFNFSKVLTVTAPELDNMPVGDTITDITKPHLPGTDININGTIYYIGSDSKRYGYPSAEVWNSWHFDNDFSNVVPANSSDLQLQIGDVVPLREIE